MVFYSKDVQKPSIIKTIGIYLLGVLIIAVGYYSKSVYAYVVGGLVIIANLMQKEKYISEEGIVDEYRIFMFSHKNICPFDEVTEIDYEKHKVNGQIALHIVKEVMIKRFICDEADLPKIRDFVHSIRPDIHFIEVKRGSK